MNKNEHIFQLIYISTPAIEFGTADLIKLLLDARNYNQAHKITGILIFERNRFLQVLEGDKATIVELFNKISLDSRHENISMLTNKHSHVREYTNWSMAFADTGVLESSHFRGFNPTLNKDKQSNTPEIFDKAHHLLKEYADFLAV